MMDEKEVRIQKALGTLNHVKCDMCGNSFYLPIEGTQRAIYDQVYSIGSNKSVESYLIDVKNTCNVCKGS